MSEITEQHVDSRNYGLHNTKKLQKLKFEIRLRVKQGRDKGIICIKIKVNFPRQNS
jgi:hypothetical protein